MRDSISPLLTLANISTTPFANPCGFLRLCHFMLAMFLRTSLQSLAATLSLRKHSSRSRTGSCTLIPSTGANLNNISLCARANGGIERDPYGSDYFFPFGRGSPDVRGPRIFAQSLLAKLSPVPAVMLTRVKVDMDLTRKSETEFFFAVRNPKHLKTRFVPISI